MDFSMFNPKLLYTTHANEKDFGIAMVNHKNRLRGGYKRK